MVYARESIDDCRLRRDRLTGAGVGKKVIDKPGGGKFQDRIRPFEGMSEMFKNLKLVEFGFESVERIPDVLTDLAHQSGANYLAEGIECHLGAVAVRVRRAERSKDAIVNLRPGYVSNSIMDFGRHEVMRIVVDIGQLIERVDKATRLEEMSPRYLYLFGTIALLGSIEQPARRHPPVAVMVEIDVLSRVSKQVPEIRNELFAPLFSPINPVEQTRSEGEVVTLSTKRKWVRNPEPADAIA